VTGAHPAILLTFCFMAHPATSNLICTSRQDQISRSPPLPFSHSQDRGIDSVDLFQSRKVCQVLCPPCKHLGTFAHSQPHATITSKLFCFSSVVENRRVVLGSAPALGAGGLRFKSGRPDQIPGTQRVRGSEYWWCCIVVRHGNHKKNPKVKFTQNVL
jgi:hypothetical protein